MRLRRRRPAATVMAALVTTTLAVAGCSSSAPASGSSPGGSGAPAGGAVLRGTLNAAGSTFQLTFQEVAISGFKSVQPGVTVNYGGVGSGAGRAGLAAGTVNFAGSDSPIPATEKAGFKDRKVLYFPVVTGPVTLSYHLSGVGRLDLPAPVLAGIFDGQVKAWDDPAIAADNPGARLPATPVTLAVRADSSGTTANFSKFLVEAAGSEWPLGTGSTIRWPSGSRAASQVAVMPDETFSAVWAGGTGSYPITYQSWDLVYAKQPNRNDAQMLRADLGYLLGAGQELLPQLGYAPLPSGIDQRAQAQLSQIGG